MAKKLDLIVALIAVLFLGYYLFKRKAENESKAKAIAPVDSYGVPIEPNSAQANEVLADINGLM